MRPDPAHSDVRENLFGGTGRVLVASLVSHPLAAPFTTVLLCELSPGGRVGAHAQEHDAEIVIALAGEAVLYVDRDAHAVLPGGVVSLPWKSTLEIDNASVTEPFVYLIVKAKS